MDLRPPYPALHALHEASVQTSPEPEQEPGVDLFIPWVPGTGVPVDSQRDFRFYAIWHIPNHPGFKGVVRAHGIAGIEAHLPNRTYAGSGARWQRAATQEAAVQLYLREADRHSAPVPSPLWRVPP